MHRLHWDLSPPKSQTPLYNPLPSPADCFDYIGTGGTGSIVALLLACGYPPEQARDRFMELAQSITDSNYDLHSLLEKVVPGPMPMWHDGKLINDFRSKCNVWIYAPKIEGNSTGMSQGTLCVSLSLVEILLLIQSSLLPFPPPPLFFSLFG